MHWLVLAFLSVLLNIFGQLLIKKGINITTTGAGNLNYLHLATNPMFVMGGGFYGVSVLLYVKVLQKIDVSVAYSLNSVGYVMLLLISVLIFKEPISILRWVGVLIICFGVYLVFRS